MIKKLAASILLAVFLFAPKLAFADTTATQLVPVADSFTDYFVPYAVQPNGALDFSLTYLEEAGAGNRTNYCYLNTETPFIKFDLSGLSEPIVSAEFTLQLAQATGLTSLPIKLVGAEDGWEESNLRYNTRLLTEAEAFTGAVAEVDGTTVTFRSVDNSLADWLEQQRLGDGTATLTLKSTGMVGCVPAPIHPSDDIEITFEDRTSQGNEPTLQLNASARAQLSIPTAVKMNNASTNEISHVRSAVFISFTGLIMMTSVAVFYQIATKLSESELQD